ncbi:MAG: cell division protein SepF [Candidatus Njordarchaeales archaeon]
MNFFRNIIGKNNSSRKKSRVSSTNLQFNQEKSDKGSPQVTDITRKLLYAVRLSSLTDVYNIVQLLKKNSPVIVSIKRLMYQDSEYAKELLSKLISFIKEINGDCLFLGHDYLILTPRNTSIIRLDQSSSGSLSNNSNNNAQHDKAEPAYSPET